VNIASFLSPKEEVTFLRDDMTIRQGLEKMKRYGYTAVPVIDAEDRYVGVVSEGDFLWNILNHNSELDTITMKSLEKLSVRQDPSGMYRYEYGRTAGTGADAELCTGDR
jgi:CBS domain-containing protein